MAEVVQWIVIGLSCAPIVLIIASCYWEPQSRITRKYGKRSAWWLSQHGDNK